MNAISSNTTKTLGRDNLPDTESDVIIQVENLHKTYSAATCQVQALRGVALSVKRGEMVAIMGPVRLRQDDAAELHQRPRPLQRAATSASAASTSPR